MNSGHPTSAGFGRGLAPRLHLTKLVVNIFGDIWLKVKVFLMQLCSRKNRAKYV